MLIWCNSIILFIISITIRGRWELLLNSDYLKNSVAVFTAFDYPKVYSLYSCVMLHMSFVGLFIHGKLVFIWSQLVRNLGICFNQNKIKKYEKPKVVTQNPASSMTSCLYNLTLIDVIGHLWDLPAIHNISDVALYSAVKKHQHFLEYVQPSLIHDPVVISALRSYASANIDSTSEAMEGAFHFIVDTGCTISASPCADDFEKIEPLKSLVHLQGVAGDSIVTHGGMLKFDCISSTGKVVTIRTFAYYNPNMSVRLFSPQAFFWGRPQREGAFTIS